jgi:hypothetical protein
MVIEFPDVAEASKVQLINACLQWLRRLAVVRTCEAGAGEGLRIRATGSITRDQKKAELCSLSISVNRSIKQV